MAYSQDTGLFYVPANHWKEDYWTEEVSYTKGSAYLGMGFRIKRMYDDHVGSLRAMDPVSGKVVWEHKEHLPLWAGAGHRRQPGVHRHRRRLLQGLRREERQGAVEIPDRQRHRLATDHLGTGRRAVLGVTVGYGGAVPLWGGDMADLTRPVAQGGSFWVFKLPSWDNRTASR